jgi:hypothetical protein
MRELQYKDDTVKVLVHILGLESPDKHRVYNRTPVDFQRLSKFWD